MPVAEDVLRLVLHAVLVVDAVARPLLVEEAPRIRPGRVLADAEDADQVASVGREEGRVRLVHVCRQPLSAKRGPDADPPGSACCPGLVLVSPTSMFSSD